MSALRRIHVLVRSVRLSVVFLLGLVSVSGPASVGAEEVDTYMDDFQTPSTGGWSHGAPSPNPPLRMPDGGPGGDGDGYLLNISNGHAAAGGRQLTFNREQWIGDFLAAEVESIWADLKLVSGPPLEVRLGFANAPLDDGVTRCVTPSHPVDGDWRRVRFDLEELIRVEGFASCQEVLSEVVEMRILHASAPRWAGDIVEAELGIDNLSTRDTIFSDGFENPEATRWSTTVP